MNNQQWLFDKQHSTTQFNTMEVVIMRHFDEFIETTIYEKMDMAEREDLRMAYDILMSECTGLGNNLLPIAEVNKENYRVATNNIYSNYGKLRYMQIDVKLLCEFLDIPEDRFNFMKNVMNMIARMNKGIGPVWD